MSSLRYTMSPADEWWLGELCSIRPVLTWQTIGEHFGDKSQKGDRVSQAAKRRGIHKPGAFHRTHNAKAGDIVRLAKNGMRQADIMRKLGLTRGQVAGIADRNHLPKLKRPQGKKPAPNPRATKPIKSDPSYWWPIPGTKPVPFLAAEKYQCRWPLWNSDHEKHRVCGMRVNEADWNQARIYYCPEHYRYSIRPAGAFRGYIHAPWGKI